MPGPLVDQRHRHECRKHAAPREDPPILDGIEPAALPHPRPQQQGRPEKHRQRQRISEDRRQGRCGGELAEARKESAGMRGDPGPFDADAAVPDQKKIEYAGGGHSE